MPYRSQTRKVFQPSDECQTPEHPQTEDEDVDSLNVHNDTQDDTNPELDQEKPLEDTLSETSTSSNDSTISYEMPRFSCMDHFPRALPSCRPVLPSLRGSCLDPDELYTDSAMPSFRRPMLDPTRLRGKHDAGFLLTTLPTVCRMPPVLIPPHVFAHARPLAPVCWYVDRAGVFALPVADVDIHVEVQLNSALVRTRVSVLNTSRKTIDVVFCFPVRGPVRCVSGQIGEERGLQSEIVDREKVDALREMIPQGKNARIRGVAPLSHFEWSSQDLFRVPIKSVGVGAIVTVEIESVEECPYCEGAFTFVMPLKFLPGTLPGTAPLRSESDFIFPDGIGLVKRHISEFPRPQYTPFRQTSTIDPQFSLPPSEEDFSEEDFLALEEFYDGDPADYSPEEVTDIGELVSLHNFACNSHPSGKLAPESVFRITGSLCAVVRDIFFVSVSHKLKICSLGTKKLFSAIQPLRIQDFSQPRESIRYPTFPEENRTPFVPGLEPPKHGEVFTPEDLDLSCDMPAIQTFDSFMLIYQLPIYEAIGNVIKAPNLNVLTEKTAADVTEATNIDDTNVTQKSEKKDKSADVDFSSPKSNGMMGSNSRTGSVNSINPQSTSASKHSSVTSANTSAAGPAPAKETGSFLTLLTTPLRNNQAVVPNVRRNVVFVIDRCLTPSMTDAVSKETVEAFSMCLRRLTPKDRFNVVSYDQETLALHEDIVPATEHNITQAETWVRQRIAKHGSQSSLDAPLRWALSCLSRIQNGVNFLFLLSNGIATSEAGVCKLVEESRTTRVLTLGLTNRCNTLLLRAIAFLSSGACRIALHPSEIKDSADVLMTSIASPIMLDIHLEKSIALPTKKSIGDLFIGVPLVFSGEYDSTDGFSRLNLYGDDIAGMSRHVIMGVQADNSIPVRDIYAREKIQSLVFKAWLTKSRLSRSAAAALSIEEKFPCLYTSLVTYEVDAQKVVEMVKDDQKRSNRVNPAEFSTVNPVPEKNDKSKSAQGFEKNYIKQSQTQQHENPSSDAKTESPSPQCSGEVFVAEGSNDEDEDDPDQSKPTQNRSKQEAGSIELTSRATKAQNASQDGQKSSEGTNKSQNDQGSKRTGGSKPEDGQEMPSTVKSKSPGPGNDLSKSEMPLTVDRSRIISMILNSNTPGTGFKSTNSMLTAALSSVVVLGAIATATVACSSMDPDPALLALFNGHGSPYDPAEIDCCDCDCNCDCCQNMSNLADMC